MEHETEDERTPASSPVPGSSNKTRKTSEKGPTELTPASPSVMGSSNGTSKKAAKRHIILAGKFFASLVGVVGGLVGLIWVTIQIHNYCCVPFGEITHPQNGAVVPTQFFVSGTLKNLGTHDHPWLAVEINDLYWPKEEVPLNEQWSVDLDQQGTPQFDLVLLIVDDETHRQFTLWIEIGHQTGDYPGIPRPEGSKVLGRVTLRSSP